MAARMSPPRKRMIEDKTLSGGGGKTQKAHARPADDVPLYPGGSPDTAAPDNARACQLQMTETGFTPSISNARVTALRSLFGARCRTAEMHEHKRFRR